MESRPVALQANESLVDLVLGEDASELGLGFLVAERHGAGHWRVGLERKFAIGSDPVRIGAFGVGSSIRAAINNALLATEKKALNMGWNGGTDGHSRSGH